MPVTSKLCRREIQKFLNERAPDVQPPAADMQKISEIMVSMMNASDNVKGVRLEHIYTAVKTMVHSLESRSHGSDKKSVKNTSTLGKEYPPQIRAAYRKGLITEDEAWNYMYLQLKLTEMTISRKEKDAIVAFERKLS
jgi:hypothetical protein